MQIDARSLPQNKTINTDLCIIGAGTAGIALARELIGEGFNVSLLESGDIKPDRQTQALYWGENIGLKYFPLDTARARYFAGSSNRWSIVTDENCLNARFRPLDAVDFEKRDWLPYSGWPFDKSYLDPFYDRAQTVCKMEPFTYETEDWEDKEKMPQMPFFRNRVRTIIFKFVCKNPFVDTYPEEIINSENISTYLNANVVEIETEDSGQKVKRLRVECLSGNGFWISAKLFILAAGGIETPRLLLQSDKTQCKGLGNQNDLVGRFFMEHMHFWSGYFIPSNFDRLISMGLYSKIHKVNGVPIIGKLAIAEPILRREKLVNGSIQLLPRVVHKSSLPITLCPQQFSVGIQSFKKIMSGIRSGKIPGNLGNHIGNCMANFDDIALEFSNKIRHKFNKKFDMRKIKLFRLAHMTEQVPNPDSRVTLGADRDRLGQPTVQLNWQLSPIDISSSIRTQVILQEELLRAGLGVSYIEMEDITPPKNLTGGWHHMGTTRMHIDPHQGVVDANCKVHGISNLYIAGPSVFPTGGQANPVCTIVALTIRLADHLKKILHQKPSLNKDDE
jgi:choline dehydrogenase-like flavoprotein